MGKKILIASVMSLATKEQCENSCPDSGVAGGTPLVLNNFFVLFVACLRIRGEVLTLTREGIGFPRWY